MLTFLHFASAADGLQRKEVGSNRRQALSGDLRQGAVTFELGLGENRRRTALEVFEVKGGNQNQNLGGADGIDLGSGSR